MKIDETTGFPELPEGYFWRVEPWYSHLHGDDPYVVEVSLRKKSTRRNWRFKTIDYDYEVGRLNIRWERLVEQDARERRAYIRRVAEEVYEGVHWKLINDYERPDIESLYGDYPPKKLEA